MKCNPFISAGLLAFSLPALANAPVNAPPTYRSGEVIVKYRDSAQSVAAKTLKSALGLTATRALSADRAELLSLPAITDVPTAVAMLQANADVEFAEPNYLRHKLAFTPSDPDFADQWGLQNTGQGNFVSGGPAGLPGGDMNVIAAWDSNGDGMPDRTGTGAVTVAIVDDGFETTHEDLAANFIAGYDFVHNDSDPSPDSSSDSHGTEVSGALGAIGNNGKGVAGVIWNVKMMPLKFGYDVASEVNALEYARAHGAQIVNASFGGPDYSLTEYNEIQQLQTAGILFVAAAGNDDSSTDNAGASYPANYRLPNIVAAAATNRQDDVASFSTYGATMVDVAAPGLQIVTTTVGDSYTENTPAGTGSVSGTSFASPYTAGIAALIKDYNSAADYNELRARLIEGADVGVDSTNPVPAKVSGGRVDAANSLNLAARPALIVQPVSVGAYNLQNGSSNIAVPIYKPVTIDDAHYGVLTPGETANITVTVQNLWQAASAVTGTLTASGGIVVNSAAQTFGDIARGNTSTATFNISVPASTSGHQYIDFTLALSANAGAYTANRHFAMEIGALSNGVTVSSTIGTDLYDEFQTFVFTVPPDTASITFNTTASNDIDILVSQGVPAQYEISLGVDSSKDPDNYVYFANVPGSQIGGNQDGDESVSINQPAAGAYFVTVVDYDRATNAAYTLTASTSNTEVIEAGHGHGSGSFAPLPLALLGGAAALRRRRRNAGGIDA